MQPTACVIIIGNEILSGRTQDKNLSWLAAALNDAGITLAHARVIPDTEEIIVQSVNECRRHYTYLFTTGGIGPTHDDITAASIAKAFGVPIRRDPEAERRLRRHYAPGEVNEARLRMADIPEGAGLIDNPVSAAPGFRIENVFVLAGVPRIMQAMFDALKPGLKGGSKTLSRALTCDLTEGTFAADLGALQQRHPAVEIGSYPHFRQGGISTSLVFRSTDSSALEHAASEAEELVRQLGGTVQWE